MTRREGPRGVNLRRMQQAAIESELDDEIIRGDR